MPENIRAVWSEDELDQALAALHPPREPDEQAFGHARTELLVSAGAGPLPDSPEKPARARRWWGAAVGTVVAVVASLLVVQLVRLGEDPGPNAAAGRLNLAADRITAVDEPLGPGQYRYIATHAWWMSSMGEYSYLGENLLETWVPADERQDWLWRREVTGARKWVSGTEAEARADGYPIDDPSWPEGEWRAPCGDWYAEAEGREPCQTPGSWQSPNAEFLASLSRDPDDLYDRLRDDTAGHGSDENMQMVVYAADMLRTGLVPADLRAALYRALGKVPGLRITEEVANLDGKVGTAFGISVNGQRHELIIDPATGQFIGERQISERGFPAIQTANSSPGGAPSQIEPPGEGLPGVPDGTVTGYTSVTTAVVSDMGVRP